MQKREIYKKLLFQVERDALRNENLIWGQKGSTIGRMEKALEDVITYREFLFLLYDFDIEKFGVVAKSVFMTIDEFINVIVDEKLDNFLFQIAIRTGNINRRSIIKLEEKIRVRDAGEDDTITYSNGVLTKRLVPFSDWAINKNIKKYFGEQEPGNRFSITIYDDSPDDWQGFLEDQLEDADIREIDLILTIRDINSQFKNYKYFPNYQYPVALDTIRTTDADSRINNGGFVYTDYYQRFIDIYNFALAEVNEYFGTNFRGGLTVEISRAEEIEPEEIIQIFQDNESKDCVFRAIENKAKKLQSGSSGRSKKLYNSLLNKIPKCKAFFPDGVLAKKHNLQFLADTLFINIKVDNLLGGNMFDIKRSDNKKSTMTINLTNTQLNHVDDITNRKIKEVSKDKIIKISKKFKNNEKYHITHKFGSTITKIETANKLYEVKKETTNIDEYLEKFKPLFIETGKNPLLDEFLEKAYVVTNQITFNDRIEDSMCLPEYDQSKSYAQFKSAPFYQGFPAKIVYFTQVSEDHELKRCGIYQGLVIPPDKKNKTIDLLEIYNGKMILITPEIQFLKSLGYKFIPECGAWGIKYINFEYKDYMLEKNEDGVPGYSVFSGRLGMYRNKYYKEYYGNEKWAKHLKHTYPDKIIEKYPMCSNAGYRGVKNKGDFIKISIEHKEYCSDHALHIASYITGYSRLNLLNQLLLVDPEKIVKINKDGFYTTEENPKLLDGWRSKEEKEVKPQESKLAYFRSMEISDIPHIEEEDIYDGDLACTGAGGCGKSFWACTFPWVDMLFLCDAYRTTTDKNEEYGIKTMVIQRLTGDNWKHMSGIKYHPSVVVLDEATKYHSRIKELKNKFPYSLFVYLADINNDGIPYQLNDINSSVNFPMKLITHKKHFDEDYRCKDPKLKELKIALRKDPKNWKSFIKEFQTISKEDLVKEYKVEDYILVARRSCNYKNGPNSSRCGEHWCDHDPLKYGKQIQYYTDMLESEQRKKYMMIQGYKGVYSGTILYEEPDIPEKYYERRHAFTVHSVQGMTIEEKIYVDASMMWDSRMFYVAVSRARYWNQIYIIEGSDAVAHPLLIEE